MLFQHPFEKHKRQESVTSRTTCPTNPSQNHSVVDVQGLPCFAGTFFPCSSFRASRPSRMVRGPPEGGRGGGRRRGPPAAGTAAGTLRSPPCGTCPAAPPRGASARPPRPGSWPAMAGLRGGGEPQTPPGAESDARVRDTAPPPLAGVSRGRLYVQDPQGVHLRAGRGWGGATALSPPCFREARSCRSR